MADIAPGGTVPAPAARTSKRRRAAGIYGAIITAAILDAAGGKIPTDALVIAVIATLVVYWLGEEYADLLGEQVEGGTIPSWAHIREELGATLPMVTASYLPLLTLVLARLADGSYGICQACGQPVGAARLAARPAARTCIRCTRRR